MINNKETPRTILLVDGHNILFRSFFGIPAEIPGKDGKTIHGVLGFIGTLLKILNRFKPSYLLIAFDSESGSFRQENDQEYKKNRILDWSTMSKNPFSQLFGIYKAIEFLSWKYCEVADFEADDILAAYVNKYKNEYKIILVSTDSDLLQLVDKNVYLFYPRGKMSVLYDRQEVFNKYGVSPESIPELKAIVGDKSDNIQGIPGVGIKTAQRILNQYKDIENLYKRINSLPEKIRMKIFGYKDLVFKNLKLIRLNQEVKLPFNLENLKTDPKTWKFKTMQVLKEIDLID